MLQYYSSLTLYDFRQVRVVGVGEGMPISSKLSSPLFYMTLHSLAVSQAVQPVSHQAAVWCVALWSSWYWEDDAGWGRG